MTTHFKQTDIICATNGSNIEVYWTVPTVTCHNAQRNSLNLSFWHHEFFLLTVILSNSDGLKWGGVTQTGNIATDGKLIDN